MVRLVGHFLALLLVSAFCTTALASDGKDALLHLPLRPPVENTLQLPLTSALSNLGSRVQGGYVIFGVEVLLKMGKEPNLTISDKQGSDLGMALDDIMRQLPNYEMVIVSAHLIDILPRSARPDLMDPLNLRVSTFVVRNASCASILAHPTRFIPELRARLIPRKEPAERGVEVYVGALTPYPLTSLRLDDVTVREILNRVSEATEDFVPVQPALGWVYEVNSDGAPNIPKNTWRSLISFPSAWHELSRPGKQSN